MQNPFRRPKFFIERQEVLSKIEKVLEDQPFKNISVVGYSGTGKKKLFDFAIEKWNKEQKFPHALFVKVDLSSIGNDRDLIFRLVRQTFNAYKQKSNANTKLTNLYTEVKEKYENNGNNWDPLLGAAEGFFEYFPEIGLKLICILYYFDAPRLILDGKCYNALAGFTNQKKVTFITISKRKIEEFEDKIIGNSVNFQKTITPIINSNFQEEHFKDLLFVFEQNGVELPEPIIHKLKYFSGNSPQLLIENASYLFDQYDNGLTDVYNIEAVLEQNALEFNMTILNELDKLGEKEVYFSLCTGSRSATAAENKKIKKFQEHGIIQSSDDGSFLAYSEYLQGYIEANTHPVPSAAVLTPPLIYISASETDKLFTDQLEMLLGGLIRSGSITMQTNLEPGQTVEKHLPEVLKKAELVFVVVSPEYSNAKHKELETIIEWQKLNKLDLVPVLYKYYDISNYGLDLDTFQTFPPKALNRWLSGIQDMDKELSEFVEFVKKRLLKKPADNHTR